MRACIVKTTESVVSEAVDQIGSVLRGSGWRVDDVTIDVAKSGRPDGSRGGIAASFEHTPQPLRESWSFAGLVRAEVDGYDVAIFSDHGGLGGVFAIEAANRRIEGWPQVWTVAGNSHSLGMLRTGRSLATADVDCQSVLDWEIAQYVASDRVICRSEIERELLGILGVETVGVEVSMGSVEPVSRRSGVVYVPGPVSRLASSGDVMRSVSGFPDVSVVFSGADVLDEYWKGTTWESHVAIRDMMGDRVSRSRAVPEHSDLVVIGDPFAGHASVMQWASDSHTPVAAPRGSVVAQQWKGVAQWDTADELAEIIAGGDSTSRTVRFSSTLELEVAPVRSDRAQRISVGIPVFGECTFLGELLASVAGQTVEVHEVIIVADSPPSQLLKAELKEWEDAFDGRLKYLEQPNRGVCVARNHILDEVTGDAVLLVDQDDILVEHALESMSGALRSNPGHDGVACWTEFFGGYNGIEAKPPFDRRVGVRENPIVSTAVLLDRGVVEDGVRFEPDLAFLYCEDWNFWAEMVARGHTLGLVPEPLVRHRVHTSSGGFRRTEFALEVGRDRARRKLLTRPENLPSE